MSAFAGLLDQPVVRNLGLSLLHFVWQGVVIATLFGAVQAALRKSSANARYLAGCVALTLMVVAPVVTFSKLQSNPLTVRPVAIVQADFGWGHPARLAVGGGESSPARAGQTTIFQQFAQFVQSTAPVAVPIWLVGIALLSIRLARDGWLVRGLKLRGVEMPEPVWIERLNELRVRIGVSRHVRLLKSALVEVPSVIGWLRPVILLPASSLTGLTPTQLESILAHELAHIRRHDYLVNAVQTLIETLLFYHPAVWWVSRCVRAERENCCDDLAVRVCGNRVTYARALATLEELRGLPPEMAFAASGGSLLGRIKRLLGLAPEAKITKKRLFSAFTILVIGLLLVSFGTFLLIQPAMYQSTVRIKVEPDFTQGEGSSWVALSSETARVESGRLRNGLAPVSPAYDPYFLQTQFEIIQSGKILGRVVDLLDLNTVWGRKYKDGGKFKTAESLSLVRTHLILRPIRNTSLIEICVRSDDSSEAAMIANAIAEVYRDYRMEQRRQLTVGGLKELEGQYREHEDKIRKVQKEMEALRQKNEIADFDAQGSAASPLPESEVINRLQATQLEKKSLLVSREEMLRKLKTLSHDELRQVLPRILPDQILTELITHLNTAEESLVVSQKSYSAEHPDVIRTKAQITDLQEKIDKAISGIMTAIEHQVASAKAEILALDKTIEDAKQSAVEKAANIRPYSDKKRELENLLTFHRILEMKIASEKVDLNLPKTSPAEIVDRAVPSLRPVSPNHAMALAMLLFGVVLSVAGLLLLRVAPKIEPKPAAA